MKRARVVYGPAARQDIEDIFEAVLMKTGLISSAEKYLARLEDRCSRIGNVPEGARRRDDLQPGIRIVPFEETLVIAYQYEGDVVEITNIISAGRDYEALLRRHTSDD